MVELKWDEKTNTVSLGDVKWTTFVNYKDRNSWLLAVHIKSAGCTPRMPVPVRKSKESNKELGDYFGCSTVVLYKHWQKLMLKAFISPIYHILSKTAFCKGRWNASKVWLIWRHREILEQAYRDGLYNILPVLMATGKSPQELKRDFGAHWKRLAKNSLNKNKVWSNLYEHYLVAAERDILVKTDLPTTVMKVLVANPVHPSVGKYLTNNFKGEWKSQGRRALHEFADARRMAITLQEPEIQYTWSARRVKEEHERLSRLIAGRVRANFQISPILQPTPNPELEGLPETFKLGDFSVHKLTSSVDLLDEGGVMKHCVASYHTKVELNRYAIYSIRSSGKRESTLGIQLMYGNNLWTVREDQHYGMRNCQPSNEAVIVVNALMKEIKTVVARLNSKVDYVESIRDSKPDIILFEDLLQAV